MNYGYNPYYDFQEPGFYSYHDFDSLAAGGIFGVLLGIYLVFLFFMMAYLVVYYILNGIGLYTIAKRRGISAPGLAWVPIGYLWTVGGIGDHYDRATTGKDHKFRIWTVCVYGGGALLYVVALLWMILMGLSIGLTHSGELPPSEVFPIFQQMIGLCLILVFAFAVMIAGMVLYYISLYRLYKAASPSRAVLFLVLSILFSVTIPFFIFFLRNRDDGLPQKARGTSVIEPPAVVS